MKKPARCLDEKLACEHNGKFGESFDVATEESWFAENGLVIGGAA